MIYGYLCEFPSTAALYTAAEKVRDAGFRRWDVHSPFPIHGMNEAMGLKRSILGWFVLCGGAVGILTGFSLQYITQVVIYPTIVQAKPANIFTVPAFFPVMFELTILFAAFTTLFGCLALMGLPRLNHPLFTSKSFRKFSDDGFFLTVERRDEKFDREKTRVFLEEIGASNVELIEDEEASA
jgi:hypothetical protein